MLLRLGVWFEFDRSILGVRGPVCVLRQMPLDQLYAASDFITLHMPLLEVCLSCAGHSLRVAPFRVCHALCKGLEPFPVSPSQLPPVIVCTRPPSPFPPPPHTPHQQTRHMINKVTLNSCKTGVKIINCARGGIVHEADLLAALESGKVRGHGFAGWGGRVCGCAHGRGGVVNCAAHSAGVCCVLLPRRAQRVARGSYVRRPCATYPPPIPTFASAGERRGHRRVRARATGGR